MRKMPTAAELPEDLEDLIYGSEPVAPSQR